MSKKTKIIIICAAAFVVVAAAITTVLCIVLGKPKPAPDPQPEQITLTLDKTECEIAEDEVIALKATTNSEDAVKWTSADSAVATVSSQGRVIGKTVGETTITASVGEIAATCKITVTKNAALGTIISFESPSLRLSPALGAVGISGTVTADGSTKSLGSANATYEIEDESIATVAADGVVTPIGNGTTAVYVTACGRTRAVTVDVYTAIVSSVTDYVAMLDHTGDKTARFYIANDIDFTGVPYKAKVGVLNIVSDDNTFMGEVDGGGHTIRNIVMDEANGYQSLFGMVTAFTLKNIAYENVQFTSGAVGCGVAVNFLQHITEGTDNVIYPSLISDASFDFVYETHGACGIAYNFYGGSIEDTFLSMRMKDGSVMNPAADVAIAKVFMIWFNPNYFNNLVVLAENGGVTTDHELQFDSLDPSAESVYVCNTKIEAGYLVRTLFDQNVWSVKPGELPKLK